MCLAFLCAVDVGFHGGEGGKDRRKGLLVAVGSHEGWWCCEMPSVTPVSWQI